MTTAPALPLALSQEFFDAVVDAVAARIEARPTKRLYTVEETAIYLGRTDTAIREMERSGKLKRASRDGRVMFDRYDLDAWIEASKG
jgi:excisionase family DNA binding protein